MNRILKYIATGMALALVLAAVMTAVIYNNPGYLISAQLIGKNIESPEKDAAMDLSLGEIKCYQIMGYGPYLPAVETDAHYDTCNRGKIVTILGTSDALHDKAHAKAQAKAANYAAIYNRYVVSNAN